MKCVLINSVAKNSKSIVFIKELIKHNSFVYFTMIFVILDIVSTHA